jgi:hypothetical protein
MTDLLKENERLKARNTELELAMGQVSGNKETISI